AERHLGQRGFRHRTLRAIRRRGEERQRRRAEPLQLPQRLAPVETERAECIRLSQLLERPGAETGTLPQRARRGVAGGAGFDEGGCVFFGEAFDLAKAEADGTAEEILRCGGGGTYCIKDISPPP